MKYLKTLIPLILLTIVLTYLTDGTFITARNLTNLARQVAINGILATGMTYVILIAGIDLSVGSVAALAGVVAGLVQTVFLTGTVASSPVLGAVLAIFAAVLTGTICGVFNGFLITRLRIAPFIITLGMMVIARGLALIFANGAAIAPLNDTFNWIGQEYFDPALSIGMIGIAGAIPALLALRHRRWISGLATIALAGFCAWAFLNYRGLPIPVVIYALIAFVGILILDHTRLGRSVLAIGGNPEAAWLAGISIQRMTLGIYVALGAMAGLSGAILAARLNGALPTAGELFELDAIAAVVIGGTSLTGGVGSVQGTILGAFLIGAMNNGMSLLDVTEFYQKVIKGVIIITAVALDMRGRK